MNLTAIGANATSMVGRSALQVQKYSPQILTIAGVAGLVTTTVMAGRAALKAQHIAPIVANQRQQTEDAIATGDPGYTETDVRDDKIKIYSAAAGQYIRIYLPVVTLGVASIASILVGHHILHQRNLGLIAAYKTLEEGFLKYRGEMQEALGEEAEAEIYDRAIKREDVPQIANGKINGHSMYARVFDELNPMFERSHDYNVMHLRVAENHANDLLQARGHVFLNEIYDALGFERSTAGAVVGWVRGEGDGYIDFGLNRQDSNTVAFMNGTEPAIWLDFNVCGVIYDKI